MTEPLVSVIIPVYNSANTIGMCLESVWGQTYRNIEVIVVDNFSKDNTKKIAQEFDVKFIELAHLKSMKNKDLRCVQRNVGAAAARGKYLLHIDSDMKLPPQVIAECVEKCEIGGFDALIIPETNVGDGYWANSRRLIKPLTRGVDGWEFARFVRKSVFDSVGGYDQTVGAGEDFDIHFRYVDGGYKISSVNAIITHHIVDFSLRDFVRKYKHYARITVKFRQKYKERFKHFISFPKLCVKRWKVFTKDIVHVPGFFILELINYILQKSYMKD